MTRTIRKKAFDDDLMLSDDFDESILDKIEKQFGSSEEPGKPGKPRAGSNLDTDEPGVATSFSLDDFETAPKEDSAVPGRSPKGKHSAPPSDTDAAGSTPSGRRRGIARRIAKPKLLMMAAACLLLVLSMAFIAGKLLTPSRSVPQIVTVIKRPVPIPVRTVEHEFLILAKSEKEKALVSLALELRYYGVHNEGQPDKDEIALRDAIYRFLSDEHPPQNSLKYWEKIAGEELSTYLKSTFPHSGLDSVKLARFTHL